MEEEEPADGLERKGVIRTRTRKRTGQEEDGGASAALVSGGDMGNTAEET